MTFNPFEQLQFASVEPRQAFEEVVTSMLRATIPGTRRVRVHQGDGGVDAFKGNYGAQGAVDVYQVKYFPGVLDDSRKQQIRESYKTARENSDYNLRKWILCVPVRFTKDDLHWFDTWGDAQDRTIELLDGDDLTDLVQKDECASVRQLLNSWGVSGMRPGGPRLKAGIYTRKLDPEKTGLTFYLGVLLYNEGDHTARNIGVEVSHDETNCLSWAAEQTLWQDESPGGRLNPRKLRCRQNINPGEKLTIMGIPVIGRTSFPFSVSIAISAEDMQMVVLHARINLDQVTPTGWIPFELTEQSPVQHKPQTSRPQPTSPAAKALLEGIFANTNEANRGVKEILQGDPIDPLNAAFLFTTARFGQTQVKTMRKRLFREAIDELLHLKWLRQPEVDHATAVYEFNPE